MRARGAWIIGVWLLTLPAAWAQPAAPSGPTAAQSGPSWDQLQKEYALPAAPALEATREKLSVTDDGTLYKVTYQSTNAQKVPGLLFLPRMARQPMPVVVLLHGLNHSKEDMLTPSMEALLAKEGFAGFAIDAPLHGERKVAGKEPMTAFLSADKTPFYQAVADVRRGLDYLATCPEVDSKRIGFYGVSLGGMLGAMIAALDPRIRASVLVVAGGDYGTLLENSPFLKQATASMVVTPELVRQFMADVDPVNFVGHISPRPVLMENGKSDTLMPPQAAEALQKAAKEPKEIHWYPGGHDIYSDPNAIKDAVSFLETNLK